MSELGISQPRRRHKEEACGETELEGRGFTVLIQPANTQDNWDMKINTDSLVLHYLTLKGTTI